MKHAPDRRSFIKQSAAGLLILPAGSARTYAANEKVSVAFVGVGGVANGNRKRMMRDSKLMDIVALCDVDPGNLGKAAKEHKKATTYADYRKMLETNKGIDAVVVSTPDHHHFPAAILSMQHGCGVAVEKPMAHSIWEARQLAIAAKKYNVQTQMDNEHHAKEALRLQVEWIQSGAIGEIRKVDIFSNRPIWPQGHTKMPPKKPVPEGLDWDGWIGPAPYRDYHDNLHRFAWRGWWDFGTGSLGDMGCHQFDPVVWALELDAPTSVVAEQEGNTDLSGPTSCTITYEFPARQTARGELPPVTVRWIDGQNNPPPRPPALEEGRKMPKGGICYYGSKETLLCSHPPTIRIVPESRMKAFKKPEPFIPRSPGHYTEWLHAIRGAQPASSNFIDYSGRLTETVLLGNLAIRTGKPIEWDAENLKAKGCPEADAFIRRAYRKGWDFWPEA